jgi:hypothetical protein
MAEERKDVAIVLTLRDGISAGMAKVNSVLVRARDLGTRVSQAFAPLQGRVAGLLAGLAGLATINRAIREATEAMEAQRRLSVALGDNVDQMGRIQQQAERISRTTVFDDDQIVATASAMLNRGVALERLSEAIEATVNTAAALGNDLDATGAQIAEMLGGTLPRELAKAVPALKALSAQELKNGDGLRILNREYKDFAANLAGDALGRIAIEQNKIGNELAKVGEVLLGLKADALTTVREELEKLTTVLETPAAKQLAADLGALVQSVIRYIPQIIAFGAAWKITGTALSILGKKDTSPGTLLGVGAAVVIVAERLSKMLDGLLGVNAELDTLEKRREIIIDVLLRVATKEIKASDIGNALLESAVNAANAVSPVAIDVALESDADRVAAGNLGLDARNRAAIEARGRALAEQAEKNKKRLVELEDEYNKILEQKDSASVERRAKIDLERTELLFEQKKIGAIDYLQQVNSLEKAELDRQLGDAQIRLTAAEAKLQAAKEKPNAAEAVTAEVVKAQEEVNKLLPLVLEYQQELDVLNLKQDARASRTGQAAAAEAIQTATEAQQRYNETIENTANLEEVGAITSTVARARVAAAAVQMGTTVKQVHDRIKGLLAAGILTQEEYDRLVAQLDGLAEETNKELSAAAEFALEIRSQLQAPFEGFFNDVIDGTKKVSDAFRDLGNDILKAIQHVLVSRLVSQFLDLLIGATTSQGGFAPGLLARGVGIKFNTGGAVPGYGPDVDSVPAMLTPGEFVIKRRAAQKAPRVLEAINAELLTDRVLAGLALPRIEAARIGRYAFNAGGPVGPAATTGPAGPRNSIQPLAVVSEQAADTIYRAGPQASRRMISENADLIRQIARGDA